LVDKQQPRKSVNKPVEKKPSLSLQNPQIQKVLAQAAEDGDNILISKLSLIEGNNQLDYLVCREKFLKEHLPILKKKLQEKGR
jgi:hypothetical protein